MNISLIFLILTTVYVAARRTDVSVEENSASIERISWCPRHETWKKCGTGCERSCKNPKKIPLRKCLYPCVPHACRCNKGYFRDIAGKGNCVKRSKCPE